MRWPLRNQIMLPMASVMLAAVVAVSVLNAIFSARRARGKIESQLGEVTSTLADSTFPLTESVLRQMRGLSGAEFVLVDEDQRVLAASDGRRTLPPLPAGEAPQEGHEIRLGQAVAIGPRRWFHAAVRLQRRASTEPALLHIFYSEQSYTEAWRQAVFPPLAVGGVALVLVIAFAAGIASRVSRPLASLREKVERIAQGDFRPVLLSRRNDEIRDLGVSVNRMADMLTRYEEEIRGAERLRTLDQLGGGIAHQMRNAATGCRMALDLHRRECPSAAPCESLDIAERQLTLMEKQLSRFLSLGSAPHRPHAPLDLAQVVQSVTPLVAPHARHVGVDLQWTAPRRPAAMNGDADALEQLLINLLLNAIEAASAKPTGANPRVVVRVCSENERVVLEVADSGPGPAADVQERLFEPFITEKRDGVGLGLPVALEIARRHGGDIRWERSEGLTRFIVEAPGIRLENARGQVVGC